MSQVKRTSRCTTCTCRSKLLRSVVDVRWYHRRVGRVDPLGQVPQALPASTTGDGYLAAAHENSSIWVTLRLLVCPLVTPRQRSRRRGPH
jgi:hypothetical protein